MPCPGMQNEETLIFLVPPAAASLDNRVALLGIQPSLLRGPADAGWFARLGYAIQRAQSMAQALEGDLAVANLGTIFRGRHHHARWGMSETHRRFGAVHMLPTGTLGAIGIHAHLAFQAGAIQRIRRGFGGFQFHDAYIFPDNHGLLVKIRALNHNKLSHRAHRVHREIIYREIVSVF